MLIALLISTLLWMAPAETAAHPLHVSVCEMTCEEDGPGMEITVKIFADDFEAVLNSLSGLTLKMGTEEEHAQTDQLIEEYVLQKLQLELDGKPIRPMFMYKEIEDIATWVYLYIEDVTEAKTITVANHVMLHWFDDQVNVVHLDCGGKMNSTFFSSNRHKETFKLQ